VAAAVDQRVDEAAPEELREMCPLQIAVPDKPTEEPPARFVLSLEAQYRFPPEQRGRIPVDDRSCVVLVEHPAQPFPINLVGFPVSSNQVFAGIGLYLLASGVQVAMHPPHWLPDPVLWMFA
jgi:hypothetical protein